MRKAGRFVGKAGCYAFVVLAGNATFSLAVNRMAAFQNSPQTYHIIPIPSSAAVVHMVAHDGICGRCGIILSRFRLRGQLQYHTALELPHTCYHDHDCVQLQMCT